MCDSEALLRSPLALPKASADRSQQKDENKAELEGICVVSASTFIRASATNLYRFHE
jgi:hypothetical protein